MGLSIPRWLIVVVLLLFVVAMLAWARGVKHHRGEDVGALGAAYAVTAESAG